MILNNQQLIYSNRYPNHYQYYQTYQTYVPQYYGYMNSQMYAPYNRNDQLFYYPAQLVQTNEMMPIKDYGKEPFVVNIDDVTEQNNTFRTVLWTGDFLQLTVMSLKVGEEIGLEVHPNLDQFIRIEEGQGLVMMGNSPDTLTFQQYVGNDHAFIIPAGKYHNLINTGTKPLKLYSIYAPVQHPAGTVHVTKADAETHH